MLESLVQLRCRRLQLHSRPQTVGRPRAPPDEAVNLFLDVDERWFHGVSSISRAPGQSKNPEPGGRKGMHRRLAL